ncbi:MAG TPA: DUF1492 domain-containing protein [Candidatus Merdenecus merdavium]|nr:DUF1492 domain-containing protein [Candidatus Merdenecus merdavium]
MDEQIKTENEKKKEYLKSYEPLVLAAKIADRKVIDCRRDKVSISMFYDDMPHGTDKKDLSDYIVRLEKLEKDQVNARYDKISRYVEIEQRIEMLKDEDQKNLLKIKYLECKTWTEVCEEVGYEWAQVHRIHNKALRNFKIYDTQ